MPTAGWWEALWPDPASFLAKVGVKPSMEIIDLCSGDGWFTLQIAKVAREVIAIDIDPSLLEVARQGLTEGAMTNCKYVAVARLCPHPVDFVFLANAFHGVPDRPRFAKSVAAILKPGGLFAIVNWHQRPREETTILGEPRGPKCKLRLSPEHTVMAVHAGGLKLTQLVEIPPYQYGAVFERQAV